MRSFQLLFTTIGLCLTLSSCGNKKLSDTEFAIVGLSALTTAQAASAGLVLMGRSADHSFTVGLTSSQASSYSMELPNGQWTFMAIAWEEVELITGVTRCAFAANVDLSGGSSSVSLNLSVAECANPAVSSAASRDGTLFKTLTLNSCLNPIGKDITHECRTDIADLNRLPGDSLSFKVGIPGKSSFGLSASGLTSSCLNITDLKSGVIPTELRIPIGGTLPIGVTIAAYDGLGCDPEDLNTVYQMPDGLSGVQGLGRNHSADDNTVLLTFADNFAGVIGSAFYTAHMSGTNITLPIPTCSAGAQQNCFQTEDNLPKGGDWATTRDAVWDLFGSSHRKNSWDFEPSSRVINGINFNVNQDNQNTVQVEFRAEYMASLSIFCNSNLVLITYDDATPPAQIDIVTAINAQSSCISDSYSPLSPVTVDSTPTVVSLVDILGVYDPKRRYNGSFNNISYSLIGHLGAMLFKAGVTEPSHLCSVNRQVTETFSNKETITISLTSEGSKTLPGFPASPTGNFERVIKASFNGELEEAFYFNCTTPEKMRVGAYLDRQMNSGGEQVKKLFWDLSNPSKRWYEKVNLTPNSQDREWRSYTLAVEQPGGLSVWTMRGEMDESITPISGSKAMASVESSFGSGNYLTFVMAREGEDGNYGTVEIIEAGVPNPSLVLSLGYLAITVPNGGALVEDIITLIDNELPGVFENVFSSAPSITFEGTVSSIPFSGGANPVTKIENKNRLIAYISTSGIEVNTHDTSHSPNDYTASRDKQFWYSLNDDLDSRWTIADGSFVSSDGAYINTALTAVGSFPSAANMLNNFSIDDLFDSNLKDSLWDF